MRRASQYKVCGVTWASTCSHMLPLYLTIKFLVLPLDPSMMNIGPIPLWHMASHDANEVVATPYLIINNFSPATWYSL